MACRVTGRVIGRAVVLALATLALVPGPVSATLYSWVDDDGVLHYTADLSSIPEARRASAREIPHPQPRAGGGENTPGAAAPPAAAPADPGTAASRSAAPSPSAAPADRPAEGRVIQFTPGGPIVVPARLNGVAIGLVVDTGADRTVISPAAVARAGIDVRGQAVNITGVTGTATATLTRIGGLDIAGVRVGPLDVVVHDGGLQGADGLLGRDVLDAFTLTVDPAQGQAVLAPR
jgi:hypothetical protein